MERKLATVESVSLIENIEEGLDLCSIELDFAMYNILGVYTELTKLIGKRVEYNTRKDMIKGKVCEVVNNLADIYTVQTIQAKSIFKLIPAGSTTRVGCNFSIDAIKYGDSEFGCVALLTGVQPGSSMKTKWVDCTMIDKNSKTFEVRIFTKRLETDVDGFEELTKYVGSYVRFNLSSTKYGYQTDEIEYLNIPVNVAPEVDLAQTKVLEVISRDEDLKSYVEQYDLINIIRNRIDGDIGYELVRMAAELMLIDTVSNICDKYDIKTLRRAVIATRGWMVPTKTKFSKPLLNVNKILASKLKTDRELVLTIDLLGEESSMTRDLYIKISQFAKYLLERGVQENDEENTDVIKLRDAFSGLL